MIAHIIKLLLWFIITFFGAVYVYYIVYPYIWKQIAYRLTARKLRRIAKTKDEETRKQLNNIADGFDDIRKQDKIFDNKNKYQ